MAEALIKGLLKGTFPPAAIRVAEPSPERRQFLAERYGIVLSSENREVVKECDLIVLAVKPQIAEEVLSGIAASFSEKKLLVSILAGVTTEKLEASFDGSPRVVRAMPNTPARVGCGVTALAPGTFATDETKQLAEAVFGAVGPLVWLEEDKLDAVTALSGSGPAYVFLVAEALVEAGVSLGLPRDVAETLTFATIEGAGRMLRQTGEPAAVLRAQVTSPGGTTAAALSVLEAMAVRAAFGEAVRAAHRRSLELGS